MTVIGSSYCYAQKRAVTGNASVIAERLPLYPRANIYTCYYHCKSCKPLQAYFSVIQYSVVLSRLAP